LAGLGLALANLPASAAPPVYSWTGLYIGGNAGFTWTDPGASGVFVDGPAGTNSFAAQDAIERLSFQRMTSGIIGGQFGYNWQLPGSTVLGFETDISWADLNFRQSVTNWAMVGRFPKDVSTSLTQHIDYFGTVRGRVGYSGINNFLIYGTGGLAYGGANSSLGVASALGFGANPMPFNLVSSVSSTRVGWTVGGGAEVALVSFGRGWSFKGEYLHYDLGCERLFVTHPASPPPGFNARVDSQFKGDLIRAGFNYKFEGSGTALFMTPR